MNLLLFFVSSIFSAIFYIFYLVSINENFLGYSFRSNIYFDTFGDLYLESILFFIIGVFFLFSFSNFGFSGKKKIDFLEGDLEGDEILKEPIFTKEELRLFVKDIFKKYNYYFAFILAYISIFFILKSFDFVSIEIFILIVNIIVLALFSIWNKFFIFRDFIKINTIFFSIYYIFLFIISFFLKDFHFEFITFFNTFFIFISFLINIYLDKRVLFYKKSDDTILSYFFSYTFLFISYYLNILIGDLALSLILVSSLISAVIYFYFVKIKYLQDNLVILRIISFSFLYIASSLSLIYSIQNGLNLIIFSILIYSIIINLKIHLRFENYISFSLSIFIIIFFIYYFYFNSLSFNDDGLLLLILGLGLSLEMVIFTYFYKLKYLYDNHFLHFISYINSFFVVLYYIFRFGLDFFTLGIILFIVSVHIFSSFYKLKELKIR